MTQKHNGAAQPLPQRSISDQLLDAWAADIRQRVAFGWDIRYRDGEVVLVSPSVKRPLFWPDPDGRLAARLQGRKANGEG